MEKEAASFQVFPVRAVRFPVQKHTVYASKTYGSASGNVGFTEWKRRKCAEGRKKRLGYLGNRSYNSSIIHFSMLRV